MVDKRIRAYEDAREPWNPERTVHPSQSRQDPAINDGLVGSSQTETTLNLAHSRDCVSEDVNVKAKRIGALEKKRARDRRAQRNLRAKRLSKVHTLEEKVETLKEKVGTLEGELQRSRKICDTLRQQTKVLIARQKLAGHLVASWGQPLELPELDEDNVGTSSCHDSSGDNTAISSLAIDQGYLPTPVVHPAAPCSLPDACYLGVSPSSFGLSSTLGHHTPDDGASDVRRNQSMGSVLIPVSDSRQLCRISKPAKTFQSSSLQSGLSLSTNPARTPPELWELVPVHSEVDVIVTKDFNRWLTHPDLVRDSPDIPVPTELLYGSRVNFLANIISETTQQWPCRDPERLAGGLFLYHYIKWMTHPSKKGFSRIQSFQRPVPEQLSQRHPYYIDFVFWPQMRSNMIKYQHLYDPAEVMSLLTCAVKLRWPWRKPFLHSDDEGNLGVVPDFYSTAMCLGGWGLTEEFAVRFPKLMEGLDLDSVCYKFDA